MSLNVNSLVVYAWLIMHNIRKSVRLARKYYLSLMVVSMRRDWVIRV